MFFSLQCICTDCILVHILLGYLLKTVNISITFIKRTLYTFIDVEQNSKDNQNYFWTCYQRPCFRFLKKYLSFRISLILFYTSGTINHVNNDKQVIVCVKLKLSQMFETWHISTSRLTIRSQHCVFVTLPQQVFVSLMNHLKKTFKQLSNKKQAVNIGATLLHIEELCLTQVYCFSTYCILKS